jgi:hypothetical protein
MAAIMDRMLDHVELELRLLRVRETASRRGAQPFDFAHLALEVSQFYIKPGYWWQIQSLAAEIVKLFRAKKVHRETLAAVVYFNKAAEKEAVTVELVRCLQEYLKEAQVAPGVRFEGRG